MKNRLLSILCSAALVFAAIPFSSSNITANAAVFKGSGTADDPYQISSSEDLFKLAELINSEDTHLLYRDSYYIQTVDIDLSNEPWTPIGNFTPTETTAAFAFRGQYNGNYHSITNLICIEEGNYKGLFGRIGENNIDFTDVCVISNLSVYGTVEGTGFAIGGITGEACTGATIRNCSFNGDITGGSSTGGLVGMTYNGGYVYNSYHNGTVHAFSGSAGGIIGAVNVGNYDFSVNAGIYNSYHTGGMVEADNGYSGGIAGSTVFANNNETYSITFENNYYLTSSCDGAVKNENATGCTKLSEIALKACADMLGSPFVDNNEADGFNDGYPIFEWQSTPYHFKGSGTEADPYQISNKYELETMRNLVNSTYFGRVYRNYHYIQTADIDLENEQWTPIGKRMKDGVDGALPSFGGFYNGNGHVIYNLYVNETEKFAGLFGSLNSGGIIENLEVHGKVKSEGNSTGGILGELCAGNGIIRNCCFFGDVETSGSEAGGVVGYLWQDGVVENCYHNGTVTNTGEGVAGGVIGHICSGQKSDNNAYVKNCYNVGKVSGTTEKIGSVVGLIRELDVMEGKTYITNCYAVNGDCATTYSGSATECNILVLTPSLLKLIAEDLGETFVKNFDNTFNNGYPIFTWQLNKLSQIMGDVNEDGKFNVSDVVLLQKWLLTVPDTKLSNWKAADFCEDNRLDVFDLCLMKRALIEQKN